MAEIPRISPRETKQKVERGEALLVCAYDDAEKFKQNRLEGAISLDDFKSKLDSLPKDQEVVFYCA